MRILKVVRVVVAGVVLLALTGMLLLSGCATNPLLVDRAPVEVKQFHPPLPLPVAPVDHETIPLTYETTRELNRKVDEGTAAPYAYFGMSEEHYLALGAWIRDMYRNIQQLRAIVGFYRGTPLETADSVSDPEPVEPAEVEEEKPVVRESRIDK